tara:strand:- start:1410 stop:2042 length:633 start_codon:yes stop_codon:yes gene_type:complete
MYHDDELIQLFPTPLLVCPYPFGYEKELEWIKNQECKRKNDTDVIHYNRQSKDTFILDNPELSKIRTFIETKLNQFVSKIYNSSSKLVITQSWLNKSNKGESHHLHHHPNSMISGVWYPVMDEKLPPIEFHKHQTRDISLGIEKHNNFNSETFLLPLKAGELILFPSHLYHMVQPNQSHDERISLSFNTWPKGDMGSIDSLTYLPFDRIN